MMAGVVSLPPVLTLAVFLLSAAPIHGYEPVDARHVDVLDRAATKDITNAACCPCPAVNAGREVSPECCSCPSQTPEGKIPLRPFITVQNDEEKEVVKSCSLITGDTLASRVTCLGAGYDKVHCFYVNTATLNVTQKTFVKGVPQESVDLGGQVRDGVVGVGTMSGKITLVGLTVKNELQTLYFDRRKWDAWKPIGGLAMEVPALLSNVGGSLTCFYRSIDNELSYVARSRYGEWSEHTKLNTEGMQSPPACVSRGEGDVEECFAAGSFNDLAHEQWMFSSGWNVLEDQEGVVKGRPCVTSLDFDLVDVFALGAKNQLMHKRLENEVWTEWLDLGGALATEPECIKVDDIQIHCFALGSQHSLMHIFYDGEFWSTWHKSNYALVDRPSCVLSSDDTISCYTRGFTDELVEVVYAI